MAQTQGEYPIQGIIEPKTECPLLKKCLATSKIDCNERNWKKCDFYLHALKDKEMKVRR
ncbi:MAG: hypothetical protein ABSC91_11650 [Candidatus Bathyarchaeia archaeon]